MLPIASAKLCHIAHPITLLLFVLLFCPDAFWMVLLTKILYLCLLFSLSHGPNPRVPKAACSKLGPSVVTADSQSSLSVCRAVNASQSANGSKASWLTLMTFCGFYTGFFISSLTALLNSVFFLLNCAFKFQTSQLLWVTNNSIFNQIINGFLNQLPLIPWSI